MIGSLFELDGFKYAALAVALNPRGFWLPEWNCKTCGAGGTGTTPETQAKAIESARLLARQHHEAEHKPKS